MANPEQPRNNKGRFAKVDGEIVPNENPDAMVQPPFASVVELQRSYASYYTKILQRSDMALRKDRRLQRQMRRDPDVMSPLFQRQSAVALLDWEIKAEDEDDPVQVEQAATLQRIFKTNMQRPFDFFMALLDATWYGPAAVQLTPELRDGYVVPGEWMPIHSDTLAFSEYGDLTMYVGLKYEGEKEQGPYGHVHTLDEEERKLVVLHTHGRQGPDYEIPEEAAYVYAGRGLRDIVWFYWLMKQSALQHWMTWVERYGMGIRIGTYPDGNTAAKDVMEEVLQNLVGDVSVVIPRQAGESKDAYSIEVQEPSQGGAQTFADLIEGYLAGQIKELIIGQTATTESTTSGLGSSIGDQHAETFRRITESDALNLADTLTKEFVWRYHEMNFGETNHRPRFEFSLEKNDPRAFMEAVQGFVALGGEVSQRQARDILGLAEPEEGEPLLNRQPQYAAEAEYMAQQGTLHGGEGTPPAQDPMQPSMQDPMQDPMQPPPQQPDEGKEEENPLAEILKSIKQQSQGFQKFRYALSNYSKADCGANTEGGGGFQPGNTCAGDEGSTKKSGSGDAGSLASKVDALYPQSPTFHYPKTVKVSGDTDWAKVVRTTKKDKSLGAYGVAIEIDGKRNGSLEWWKSTADMGHAGWIVRRLDGQGDQVGGSGYAFGPKSEMMTYIESMGSSTLKDNDHSYNYESGEEYSDHVVWKARGVGRTSSEELGKLLLDKGGFTYQPYTNQSPTSGLVVSTYPKFEQIIESASDAEPHMIKESISGYINDNWNKFRKDQRAHFGGWWDKDSDRIYLDLSTIVEDHDEAMSLAKEHKQEAYFDLSTFETIQVGARDD